MDIQEFVGKFNNHPILFVGTGISLRYLNNSFRWEDLLSKISFEIHGTNEHFIDLKKEVYNRNIEEYDLAGLASILEKEFDKYCIDNREGKFKGINDRYYEEMERVHTSRMKIFISELLRELDFKADMSEELAEFKKSRKNIGSVITTNYDNLIEELFEFQPLVGNNILLSNPYGSVYKIHGCINEPENIIIIKEDYEKFEKQYELIRAQLLSLFIHNPIIFIGYSIRDNNIRKILETIFTYVNHNIDLIDKVRSNFLLVEYQKGSENTLVLEHDIDINGTPIRINKIKTDNYISIYKAIANLRLSISAMDIRKVQGIVSDIYQGGKSEDSIKVRITEDLDELDNSDKVLAIGSEKTIRYEYRTVSEMMEDYFTIIEESNEQILDLIDKQVIQSTQYFPIFAFSKINTKIEKEEELKENQKNKLKSLYENIKGTSKKEHFSINSIEEDESIAKTYKIDAIIWNVLNNNIYREELRKYVVEYSDKKSTEYRKLLCLYDYFEYADRELDKLNI